MIRGGRKLGIVDGEVSIPNSDGMNRFTPASRAALMINAWRFVDNVAIVDMTASWFLKAKSRDALV